MQHRFGELRAKVPLHLVDPRGESGLLGAGLQPQRALSPKHISGLAILLLASNVTQSTRWLQRWVQHEQHHW